MSDERENRKIGLFIGIAITVIAIAIGVILSGILP